MMSALSTILIFLVALSILVFVHEWGHFYFAKRAGIRVDVFSIGFGPKLFSFTWHGTEYRIAPILFGGYVKIYGHEPMEEADGDPVKAAEIASHPDAFAAKSYWEKLSVVLAGPVMNIILCLVVLPVMFMVGRLQPKILLEPPVVIGVVEQSPAELAGFQKGDLIQSINGKKMKTWNEVVMDILMHPEQDVSVVVDRAGNLVTMNTTLIQKQGIKQSAGYLGIEPFEFMKNKAVVGNVMGDSPAQQAGLLANDTILSIDGTEVKDWDEMTKLVSESNGNAMSFLIEREKDTGAKETVSLSVLPEFNKEAERYLIGIQPFVDDSGFVLEQYGFVESLSKGYHEFVYLVRLTGDVLATLVTKPKTIVKSLGGPLMIAKEFSSAARAGMGRFLFILAFLSLQLGILNLLPIPVLDGGHIVFLTIEAVRRKTLPYKLKMVSMQVGVVLLLSLMVYVTFNDVENMWGFANILAKIKGVF